MPDPVGPRASDAGIVALYGLGALVAAAIMALGLVVPMWLSAVHEGTARRAHGAATDRRGKPLPTMWAGIGAVPVVVGVVLMLRPRRRQRPRSHQGRRR